MEASSIHAGAWRIAIEAALMLDDIIFWDTLL